MRSIDVGVSAPAGFVRAVFSRRHGGHSAPLDLVRAHLRAVGIRRRCRDAFAGYLVTDSDDEALRALEAVQVPAFSWRREFYRGKVDALCVTGGEGEAGRFAGGLGEYRTFQKSGCFDHHHAGGTQCVPFF